MVFMFCLCLSVGWLLFTNSRPGPLRTHAGTRPERESKVVDFTLGQAAAQSDLPLA
jgi:hypothetical protein